MEGTVLPWGQLERYKALSLGQLQYRRHQCHHHHRHWLELWTCRDGTWPRQLRRPTDCCSFLVPLTNHILTLQCGRALQHTLLIPRCRGGLQLALPELLL